MNYNVSFEDLLKRRNHCMETLNMLQTQKYASGTDAQSLTDIDRIHALQVELAEIEAKLWRDYWLA